MSFMIKLAAGLFLLHLSLYIAKIAWLVHAGIEFNARWLVHVLTTLSIALMIKRNAEQQRNLIAGFAFVSSALWVHSDYQVAQAAGALPRAMLLSLALWSPLVAGGVCVYFAKHGGPAKPH